MTPARTSTPAAELPDAVRRVTQRAVALVEQRLPGYLTGLHLHGSLCWGEFFPGSDIDFVATTTRRPNERDIALLRQIHRELSGETDHDYDGFYLPQDDLADDPSVLPVQPGIVHGEFSIGHHDDATLVTWHELAQRGITVQGRPAGALDIFTSDEVLRLNTLTNLESYWLPAARRLAGDRDEGLAGARVPWLVLGVLRLHHLLTEHTLTAKSAAGRWALTTLDELHHPIVREALSWREHRCGTEAFADNHARLDATLGLLTQLLSGYGLHVGSGPLA